MKIHILLIHNFFRKLNELAFSESAEITSTPEVAPQKEGLLALAYRMMTAPFTIRTPKNVTTRTRKKSNPVKLVSPSKISGSSTETVDSDRRVPPHNEMFLLNARCEKNITDEVQFYFKNYNDFVSSDNQKLVAVLSALNLSLIHI